MKKIIFFPITILKFFLSIFTGTINAFRFMILIWIYAVFAFFAFLGKKLPPFRWIARGIEAIMIKLDGAPDDSISKLELIDLAMDNMKAKKSRTIVTIGGMTVGIAVIVFLVSIGFGVQSLVVSKVARLEEMRQTEVSTPPKSNLYLNDEVITTFKALKNVEVVLPQIAVVGKVNYNNSSTDMAVYGVTKDYLVQSAISPVVGESFESNETANTFTVKTDNSSVIADELDEKDEVLVGDWVVVSGESNTQENYHVTTVTFPDTMGTREAVVNRAFLNVLSIDEETAVGKAFNVSFIATGKILNPGQDKISSVLTEYTIVGVTPDDSTPVLYVPFIHLKSMGLKNYSQLKVVVDLEENLADVRQLIESQGFVTTSVTDTLRQIYNLFSTVRTILALLGTVALFVAALGMFNTLTVSLLERTKEIGLLRAMGMRSNEIRDSFLSESMIMGSLGGVLGLFLGYIFGKILEIILTVMAQDRGLGWVSVVEIPLLFIMLIIGLSFFVGVITGVYPARRATRISALNALRYE